MIAFIIIAFFLTFYLTYHLNNNQLIESASYSFLITAALIVISTETLSFLNSITLSGIASFWIIYILTVLYINKTKNIQYISITNEIKHNISSKIFQFSKLEKLILLLVFLLLSSVFIQGIIYPPNNWDSLSYHLPRIVSWQNHGNLDNYATHIIRQLYQPPLCEYFILHFNTLSRNDIFSNSVQFFFLIGTIISVLGLSNLVFKKINYIWLLVIASTIPHALLEGSSTQNDIVHSFFIVLAVYVGIKLIRKLTTKNIVLFSLTVGLSLLTKAIAYIYMPIIVGTIGVIVLFKIIKTKDYKKIVIGIIGALIVLVINAPHSYRNYEVSKDIMGTDKTEKADYLNEEFKPKFILSTVIKNIGLHFDSFYLGNLGNQVVEKLHLAINQDINAPGSNVFDMKYNCNHDWKFHEDTQPNFTHLLLFSLTTLLLLIQLIFRKRKLNTDLLIINSLVIAQFIFFCIILTWEPWNTRLHLPLFFLMCPSIYLIFKNIKSKTINNILLLVIIIYGFYVVLFNYSRPIINSKQTANIKINDTRYKKYFSNQLMLYKDYDFIRNKLKNADNIGLIIINDTWEYPLYASFFKKGIHGIHINVSNYTKTKNKPIPNLDYIISNTLFHKSIIVDSIEYKNISLKNKKIWIYKR